MCCVMHAQYNSKAIDYSAAKGLPSRCSTVHLKPHLYKAGLTCMGGDQQATHCTLYKLLIFIHPPPLGPSVHSLMPFAIHLRASQPRSSISCEKNIDSVCEPRQPNVKNNSRWTAVRWERGAIFITALQKKKALHLQSDVFLTLERQPFYRTLMLSVWVCPCEVFFPHRIWRLCSRNWSRVKAQHCV